MGFIVTSEIKVKGVKLPSGVYVTMNRTRPLLTYSRENSDGSVNYFARCYMFMFPSECYYLAKRHESSWFNDALEEEIPLTYEQYVGNVRETVYSYWKSKLTKEFANITFKDVSGEAQPVVNIVDVDGNLVLRNCKCKYYVISSSVKEVKTIKSNGFSDEKGPDFVDKDILVLQFTSDTVVKHDAKDLYAPIRFVGNVDFVACDECILTLMFDGTAWNEVK